MNERNQSKVCYLQSTLESAKDVFSNYFFLWLSKRKVQGTFFRHFLLTTFP
jgi:hypothetical protein